MIDKFESQVIDLLSQNIESAWHVYQSFPSLMSGLRLEFWSNVDALIKKDLTSFPEWICDFDGSRARLKADVVYIKPLSHRNSEFCCGISLGQGSVNPAEIKEAYLGVQFIRTEGTPWKEPPWKDPRTSELETKLNKAGLGRHDKQNGWICYKNLDVRLHDLTALKRIAQKDQSTEEIVVEQTINLLRNFGKEIIEVSAVAAGR
jgi:hypothetical protein